MISWLDTRIRKIQSAVPWPAWALLAILFFGMLWASHVTTDEWISDSRLYLAWSYRYLGYSEVDAARMTYEALAGTHGLSGCDFCWPPGYEYSLFHGENGAVAAPRMIYPLFSAPFVGMFGASGMLVIPLLAYAIGAMALVALASRLWGRWWGAAAGAAVLLSAISMRFAATAMTDSLALMFNTLALLFLPIARQKRRGDLWWFLGLLVLNLFTRQFAITVTVGVALVWLLVAIRDRQWRNQWLPFAAGSVVVTGIVLQIQSVYAASLFDGKALSLTARYQQVTTEKYGVDGLASIPAVVKGLIQVDYDYVRRADIYLIALIALTAVTMLWRWRSELSALFTGMAVATMAMTVIIVDPTFFRYFVPLIPLMILCALALLRDLFVAGIRPSFSKEDNSPVPDKARSRQKLSALGPFGMSWLAWIFMSATFALTTYLVWREHLKFGPPRLVLYAIGMCLFLIVVIKRSGVLAGALATAAAMFSFILAEGLLSSFLYATAFPLIVVGFACLPGSGFAIPTRMRYAIFTAAMGAAVVLTTRTVSVTAAIVGVWVLASIRLRSPRNEWAVLAGISAVLSAVGGFLSVHPAIGAVTYGRMNLDNMKSTAWEVTNLGFAWDRISIAILVTTGAVLLAKWKSELTWLAVFSGAAAAIIMYFGHPHALTGYFAYAILVFLLVTASHLSAYVQRDLAARQLPAPPEPPVIATQRTGAPANA